MAVSTHSAPRGLGGFLAVLEQRLAALPVDDLRAILVAHAERLPVRDREAFLAIFPAPSATVSQVPGPCQVDCPEDRKSTRLNSSHVAISYAVFCLKKKKNHAEWPWVVAANVNVGQSISAQKE